MIKVKGGDYGKGCISIIIIYVAIKFILCAYIMYNLVTVAILIYVNTV